MSSFTDSIKNELIKCQNSDDIKRNDILIEIGMSYHVWNLHIIGPKGTPYFNAPYVITIKIPNNEYPTFDGKCFVFKNPYPYTCLKLRNDNSIKTMYSSDNYRIYKLYNINNPKRCYMEQIILKLHKLIFYRGGYHSIMECLVNDSNLYSNNINQFITNALKQNGKVIQMYDKTGTFNEMECENKYNIPQYTYKEYNQSVYSIKKSLKKILTNDCIFVIMLYFGSKQYYTGIYPFYKHYISGFIADKRKYFDMISKRYNNTKPKKKLTKYQQKYGFGTLNIILISSNEPKICKIFCNSIYEKIIDVKIKISKALLLSVHKMILKWNDIILYDMNTLSNYGIIWNSEILVETCWY